MALPSLVGAPHRSERLDVPLRSVSMRSASSRQASAPQSLSIVERVRGEFVEMRGFSPTVEQAARLFDLSKDACRDILSALTREGFLRCTPDGRYRLPPQA